MVNIANIKSYDKYVALDSCPGDRQDAWEIYKPKWLNRKTWGPWKGHFPGFVNKSHAVCVLGQAVVKMMSQMDIFWHKNVFLID